MPAMIEERLEALEHRALADMKERIEIGVDVLALQIVVMALAELAGMDSPDPVAFLGRLRQRAV